MIGDKRIYHYAPDEGGFVFPVSEFIVRQHGNDDRLTLAIKHRR